MIHPSTVLRSAALLGALCCTTGCILNAQGTWCETIDANFHGCYKRDFDARQYIAIVQGDCGVLVGTGRGTLPDLGELREWGFSGRVTARDDATLTITLEGTGEERTLLARQGDADLTLRESGHSARLVRDETCP